MVLSVALTLAVAVVAAWLIYKTANKAWKKADVQDKLEELEVEDKMASQVKGVNPEKAKRNREKVNKVLDL